MIQQIAVLLIVWILNFQSFDTEYKILQDILPELIELTDRDFNFNQKLEYYIEDSLLNDKQFKHVTFDDIEDEELREISKTLKGAKAIVFDLLNHYSYKVMPASNLKYDKNRYQIGIALSRIVASEDKAVCIIDFTCDPDCGGGGFLILQKNNGEWNIQNFDQRWIY